MQEQDATETSVAATREQIVQNVLDLDPLVTAEELEAEVTEFTGEDRENQLVLEQGGLKRLACYSHKLQLVVTHFDVFRNSSSTTSGSASTRRGRPSFASSITKAKKLVSRFNTSSVATGKLIEKRNKKLVSDVTTRWSSTYLIIDRLVDLKDTVEEICKDLKWNGLLNTDWAMLENLGELLQPFAYYTQLMTGSKVPTLPSIFPSILELKGHLNKVSLNSYCCIYIYICKVYQLSNN